jgi:hypothetical protein
LLFPINASPLSLSRIRLYFMKSVKNQVFNIKDKKRK